MKQVFMCEYCGTMSDENSIREHEETCSDFLAKIFELFVAPFWDGRIFIEED